MKRFMIFALIAALLIASSYASAEDEAVLPLPELMEALRDAGREAENILAYDVYMNGDTLETAMFLVQSGDTAQLTERNRGRFYVLTEKQRKTYNVPGDEYGENSKSSGRQRDLSCDASGDQPAKDLRRRRGPATVP